MNNIRARGNDVIMEAFSNTLSQRDIRRIADADDFHIAPFRDDGVTYGTPTWIWSVAVDDSLYVRAYNGRKSKWYNAAIKQKAGKIEALGLKWKVRFEPVPGEVNNRIDEAYSAKYSGSPYLKAMISSRAREATVRILPA